jgi:hypothetical protein
MSDEKAGREERSEEAKPRGGRKDVARPVQGMKKLIAHSSSGC